MIKVETRNRSWFDRQRRDFGRSLLTAGARLRVSISDEVLAHGNRPVRGIKWLKFTVIFGLADLLQKTAVKIIPPLEEVDSEQG